MDTRFTLFAIDPKTLFIIGILMIGVVLLRVFLRPKKSGEVYHSPLREKGGPPAHMLDAPAEISQWEVQMHETARDLMGELNTKIAIVEQLVRDANAAAERLEKAIERAEKLP
jgi:hypothetical protein